MSEILANVFLGCFIVGLLLSMASLLFGMDHGGHDGVDFGHHLDVGHDGSGHDGGGHDGDGGMRFFSFTGIVIFLTWFGGVGYILNRHSNGLIVVTLLGAIAAGLAGAAVIFYFMNSFLLKGQTEMRATDYYMPGTLAKVCSSIREGGTGEIVYVQGGTRKTSGARAEDGTGLNQGEEVVVIRYEKGIAYVKPVDDVLGES